MATRFLSVSQFLEPNLEPALGLHQIFGTFLALFLSFQLNSTFQKARKAVLKLVQMMYSYYAGCLAASRDQSAFTCYLIFSQRCGPKKQSWLNSDSCVRMIRRNLKVQHIILD